ncbi:MAG: macro domain-containing protein [Halanaerobiales bacterium]|nr:macro domain-containing protein [Halanaerobiales bacterium]
MFKDISGVEIELLKGDIADQKNIEAVINAANAQLRIGGGVAGAIHRKAGPKLEKECEPLAPIKPGEAVITGAYGLPNDYVIHCLGPVYGVDKPEAELLKRSYQNALQIADKNKIKSIAFPAISTGAFGYPKSKATEIAIKTVKNIIPELEFVKKIRFVLYNNNDLELYKKTVTKIID